MLNENIKKYRKEKGISQEELADKIHVVRQTVSKWEKGYSVPDSDVLQKIATQLNVTVSDLLGSNSENNSEETTTISKQLEIINNTLSKEVKKRKMILKICAAVLFLVVAVLLFLKFTYLNPYLAYAIAKPYDKETDKYCEHIALCYQTRLNMPLNKEAKEILTEFTEKSHAIQNDLDDNYRGPMKIVISVVTDRDYTKVTYSGTVTKDGEQQEYMDYFFVMKELKPAV